VTDIAVDHDDAEPGEAAMSGNDRRCVVTRESGPRDRLIRFVVAPDGMLTPDLAENLPGRGLWISASRQVVSSPGVAKAVSRAAKQRVTLPDDLVGLLERLLVARCQNLLGLARRSGATATGFGAVRDAVVSDQASLLLTARDSVGRDGRELAHRAKTRPVRVWTVLDAEELGAALGRERQVHVAVAAGPLADRLDRDLQRLAGFRASASDAGHEELSFDENAAALSDGEAARTSAQGR